MDRDWLDRKLGFLPSALREEIAEKSTLQTFPAGTVLVREGEYVKVIPVVRRGLIKVSGHFEDRELLLYYIQAEESCIMSFSASLEDTPSQIEAVTEEETEALLLPSRLVRDWLRAYPSLNQLFYHQYHQRYRDLLQTIHLLLFNRMDQRLLEHLRAKARLSGENRLPVSHRQLAEELGTAREVISRVMKKLEQEGMVRQLGQGWVEVLS